jgi:hypothetical protein
VAKLLNYAPAKPAHRDSAPIVSIEGFQGCGVAGSGRKSHLNVQQNAYLKGSITPEYSFSDFVFVLDSQDMSRTMHRFIQRTNSSHATCDDDDGDGEEEYGGSGISRVYAGMVKYRYIPVYTRPASPIPGI